MANEIGIEKIRAIAKDFGIRSSIGKGLAVALGSSEVNLLELTSAYAGFLSNGKKVNPIGLRLGINRTWDSRWFAKGNAYTKLLGEDLNIKSFLKDINNIIMFFKT